ncbi:hypothetical protein N9468_04605 [Flavobacteriaceae bacterium]|nr:hypothetical protein [Flavobacteriaceae bacterium]
MNVVGQIIDLSAPGSHADGEEVRVDVRVTEQFDGGGVNNFIIETGSLPDLSDAVSFVSVFGVVAATLEPGYSMFPGLCFIGNAAQRYARMTVIGGASVTTGRVSAGIVVDAARQDFGELGV